MAYTNSPQFNTYKTITFAFNGTDMFRSGDITQNRDLQIVNFYYDKVATDSQEKITKLKKRPGLAASSYSLTKVASSDVLRGSFYDVDQNAFYWAVGNKLYAVKPDVGTTVRTVATLNTSSGKVGFCSYLKSDNTRYVCASDGTDLWLDNYVAVSCTRVTDVDFPTPHKPDPVYLNGYIFLIKSDTGDIYNSVVDDPFDWTPGDFMTAEISSDYALRLVKSRNYLVCFGYKSIEYFYDAGVATGSPLQRNESPFRALGYISGLATIGDVVYFVGQDNNQNIGVFALEGFKLKRVSTAVVDRTLQTYSTTSNVKSNVDLDKDGYSISVDGHNFYVLPTETTTWVYDIDENIWYEWKNPAGAGLAVEAVWGMYNGATYVAIAGQSFISILSGNVYQDFGVNYTCKYTTQPIEAETFNWKTAHRLAIHCSQHDDTGTSNIAISWSDKDWSDAGTIARNVNVFSTSPYITRLGRFRKRSFKFEYTDNYPLWLVGVSLDINVGQN